MIFLLSCLRCDRTKKLKPYVNQKKETHKSLTPHTCRECRKLEIAVVAAERETKRGEFAVADFLANAGLVISHKPSPGNNDWSELINEEYRALGQTLCVVRGHTELKDIFEGGSKAHAGSVHYSEFEGLTPFIMMYTR